MEILMGRGGEKTKPIQSQTKPIKANFIGLSDAKGVENGRLGDC